MLGDDEAPPPLGLDCFVVVFDGGQEELDTSYKELTEEVFRIDGRLEMDGGRVSKVGTELGLVKGSECVGGGNEGIDWAEIEGGADISPFMSSRRAWSVVVEVVDRGRGSEMGVASGLTLRALRAKNNNYIKLNKQNYY